MENDMELRLWRALYKVLRILKQTNKQASKQASKQTNKQTTVMRVYNKQCDFLMMITVLRFLKDSRTPA